MNENYTKLGFYVGLKQERMKETLEDLLPYGDFVVAAGNYNPRDTTDYDPESVEISVPLDGYMVK